MEKQSEFSFEGGTTPEIEPKWLERMRELGVPPLDQELILLAKGGLKPASEVIIILGLVGYQTNESQAAEERRIGMWKLFHGMGFYVGQQERLRNIEDFGNTYNAVDISLSVANKEEDLKRLQEAFKFRDNARTEDDKKKQRELFGVAFGFPQSAIEAMNNPEKRMKLSDLPKWARESDGIMFFSPTLSRDNWQEEIRIGEERAAFIKRVSPDLYQEILNHNVDWLRSDTGKLSRSAEFHRFSGTGNLFAETVPRLSIEMTGE